MRYRVRVILPSISSWSEIEAPCPEIAVREFHFDKLHDLPNCVLVDDRVEGQREKVHFARIEVEAFSPGRRPEGPEVEYVPAWRTRWDLLADDPLKERDSFVSRCYSRGIYRRGGVKRPHPTFEERLRIIAETLKYDDTPASLLDPWDFEDADWT